MATADPEPINPPTSPVFVPPPPSVLAPPPPIVLPEFDLPAEDGVPMETPWHRSAMNLLIDVVHWHRRDRTDYYVGGNMFIYYGEQQANTWEYRGPDFFFVDDVDGKRERRSWIIWKEAGRYPDVIIELTSPSTLAEDHGIKKKIYERTFRTPDYFCYEHEKNRLEGWRLNAKLRYQALEPNDRGWLWCEELGVWLGTWEGRFQNQQAHWPRFYDVQGQLILTEAEYQSRQAEHERQRAAQSTAELERLKSWLAQQGLTPPNP